MSTSSAQRSRSRVFGVLVRTNVREGVERMVREVA